MSALKGVQKRPQTGPPAKFRRFPPAGLGTFATGAGPVIAPDGSVYLGRQEGKLIGLHADGKPFWSRDVDPGESIVASPT
jgi:outer membrane protein assembly factor BamB